MSKKEPTLVEYYELRMKNANLQAENLLLRKQVADLTKEVADLRMPTLEAEFNEAKRLRDEAKEVFGGNG